MAVLEYMLARSYQEEYVSWESSKMMILIFRCLRYCYEAQAISREASLWLDRKTIGWKVVNESESEVEIAQEGMGMCKTMKEYGFAWFLPKINWKTWTFDDAHGRNINVGNPIMLQAYRARWQEVRDIRDVFLQVEEMAGWLSKWNHPKATLFVQEYMTHLCFLQFRKEVWCYLKDDVRKGYREQGREGLIQLDWNSLNGALRKEFLPPYCVTSGCLAIRSIKELVNYFWNFDDNKERKHWDDYAFRALYRRCVQILRKSLGDGAAFRWESRFKRAFICCHFFLPYPHREGFWQRNKDGQRMWVAVWNPYISWEEYVLDGLSTGQFSKGIKIKDWSIGLSKKKKLRRNVGGLAIEAEVEGRSMSEIGELVERRHQDGVMESARAEVGYGRVIGK